MARSNNRGQGPLLHARLLERALRANIDRDLALSVMLLTIIRICV